MCRTQLAYLSTTPLPTIPYTCWSLLSLALSSSFSNLGLTLYHSQFQNTGDFIFPNFRQDLEYILNQGIRVSMVYGDADYICNWFGGEAVSLALNYTDSAKFAAAGYEPFVVDGTEYGEVRQYGNC